MLTIRKHWKKIIVITLFVLIYGWVFWHIVDSNNTINTIIASISWYMLSLILRSIISLSVSQTKIFSILIIGIILSSGRYLLWSVTSRWGRAALILLHSIYRLITYNIHSYTHNSIRLSRWWLSVALYTWVALCMSIGYSMLIMAYNQVSWLDCTLLRNESMRIVEQLSVPLTLGTQQIISIKDSIAWRFDESTIQTGITLGSIVDFSGNSSLSIAGIPLLSWNIINDFFNERKNIDLGSCDYTLAKLKEIYARPNTQITFIVSLTILIMLFINIIIWIWTVITRIIWSIIAHVWFFQRSQIPTDKDMIE